MKKILALLSVFILVFSLVGCKSGTEPIVKTITFDKAKDKYNYSVIYDNGKSRKTDEFETHEINIYHVDSTKIISEIFDNKIKNHVDEIIIHDKNGVITESALLSDIVNLTAQITEHQIMDFIIMEDNGEYFSFVKLNTGPSDPCCFYRYNSANNSLEMLYSWDNVDLIGISVN